MGRLLIIGFDGATFDLIEPWAKEGRLPNLARLMAQGAWGRLESTIPAHSGPAWSTFTTGLLPGQHGVYHFVGLSRDEKYFRPVSSDAIRGRALWEWAGAQGARVGVINVPLTYPPRPVNGYMISGIFAPDAASAFWPPELYEEVTRACGEYTIEVYGTLNRRAQFDTILAAINRRLEVAEYLMERHPVDVMTVVFRMLDSVQHKFWADMDPGHPARPQLKGELLPEAILECHRTLDAALGRLLEKAGPQTRVLVLSDHGFRGEYRRLAINKWLHERGLLYPTRGSVSLAGKVMATARQLGLSKLLGNLVRTAAGPRYRTAQAQRMSLLYRSIDWQRTQVVFGPNHGFNINLKGRDPEGIVTPEGYEPLRDRLIQELKTIRDPETGRQVIAEVHRREEIYQGEAVDLAPDLVPVMAEQSTGAPPGARRWGIGLNANHQAWTLMTPPSLRMTGDHAPDGIFLACGPGIRPGRLEGLRLVDVAPTALYAAGLTVPRVMEGKVRTELFDPGYLAAHPVSVGEVELASAAHTAQGAPEQDEAMVEARLRDLGYL